MHFLGLAGMPRRIPDYPDAYHGWNVVASSGGGIVLLSTVLFLFIVYKVFRDKKVCPPNPWGKSADTLEWTLPSSLRPFKNY